MNLVSCQFSCRGANENIHAINSGETFESRREINGVANDCGVHPLVRANVADDHLALIDADAHAEPHAAFLPPSLIELP